MRKFGIALLLLSALCASSTTGYTSRSYLSFSDFYEQKVEVPYQIQVGNYVQLQAKLKYSQKDVDMMAKNLYFEYRNEKASDIEIAQIGYVVLNRLKSKGFPNTIPDVIWQPSQFSWTHDGKSDKMTDRDAKERAERIAKAVLEGTIPNRIGKANHYLNKRISKASWWKDMKFVAKFGEHSYYEY